MCFILRPPDAGHDELEASRAFDRSIRAEMSAQAERSTARRGSGARTAGDESEVRENAEEPARIAELVTGASA